MSVLPPWEATNMTESSSRLIDALIEERHKNGLTQAELAASCSLTQSVIARLENKKASPQLDTLMKVAIALNCDIRVVKANC